MMKDNGSGCLLAALGIGLVLVAGAGCVNGEVDTDMNGGGEAELRASAPEVVVNMFDAGLLFAVTPTGGNKTLGTTDLLSCVYSPDSITGAKYGMAYIRDFVPQLGKKYVAPIHEDATCTGTGLTATLSVYSTRDVDVFLEDIATGQAITMAKPDGCTYAGTTGSSGFISMLNPPNVQLVIRARKTLSDKANGEAIGYIGWMANAAEVAKACYYESNWPWPGN